MCAAKRLKSEIVEIKKQCKNIFRFRRNVLFLQKFIKVMAKINVKDTEIIFYKKEQEDYISLTDNWSTKRELAKIKSVKIKFCIYPKNA